MKLSIITINFNDKTGLEKTINSIINQTWADFEFIVIDGASTDGSKEILEKYQNQISHWISEPDTGVYNAMNKGIRIANGEYLIFMNSGDSFVDPTILEKIAPQLEFSTDIVFGDAIFVANNDETIINFPKKLNFSFFYENSLCHQSTFLHKSLFLDNQYNEYFKIVSDWEFNVKNICLYGKSYKHIDEVICYYDLNGISSTQKILDLEERNKVYKIYFSTFIDDYNNLKLLQDKRIKNIIYIKQFNIPWKILKAVSKAIFLFLPKQKKTGF